MEELKLKMMNKINVKALEASTENVASNWDYITTKKIWLLP